MSAEIMNYIVDWIKDINNSEPIFNIEGKRIELILRDLPHHQVYYSQRAVEANSVLSWLRNIKAKREAIVLKNYLNTPRALSVKEQTVLSQGEPQIVEINQLIVEVEFRKNSLEEIVEAIKQLAWSMNYVTRMRVAEMEDAVI
jgi:hypothetical protein